MGLCRENPRVCDFCVTLQPVSPRKGRTSSRILDPDLDIGSSCICPNVSIVDSHAQIRQSERMITQNCPGRSGPRVAAALVIFSCFLASDFSPAPVTAFLLVSPAVPSLQKATGTPQNLLVSHLLPPSQLSSAPMTDGGTRTRSSIFPPPLMSFYGEQRRKLQEETEAKQMEWAKHFNELIVTQGQELCVCGYEGYVRSGSKGAVAVYCDDEAEGEGGAEGQGGGLHTCSSLSFTTLEELLADPRMDDGVKAQLSERVTSYEPDSEVAVLFAYNGQVGLNVLRPQYPPKFLFETLRGKK